MDNPAICIVILSLNHWEKTRATLLSLGDVSTPRFETVLIDNGSSPEIQREIANFQQSENGGKISLQCRFNQTNEGVASGRNQGASQANADVLLFLDNDVESIDRQWLRHLYDALNEDGSIAVAGGVLLNPDVGRTVQFTGGTLDERCRLHFFERNDAENNQKLIDTDYCLGACLMTRKTWWERLNGFDPLFDPMDYEDIDFCLKTKKNGRRCVIDPRARLIHHKHTTTGTTGFSRMRNYMIKGRKFKNRWQNDISKIVRTK